MLLESFFKFIIENSSNGRPETDKSKDQNGNTENNSATMLEISLHLYLLFKK